MGQSMNLKYDSVCDTIYNIKDVNSSFASGTLKVMYTGENRNGSFISQRAVNKALPSLYNVPIVCHWSYEDGEIGGHDVDVVSDDNGDIRFRNLTEPCGVVPEHATFRFETMCDENGTEHEYLVIDDVLLWKRQDVFGHIVNDLGGCVDHSMEITVKSGYSDKKSGKYIIDDFEFTALCLLERDTPCFEGSELTLFSATDFKSQMEQMMAELKETLFTVNTQNSGVDIENIFTKGGCEEMEAKIELIKEFGLTVDDLDFAIDDYSIEDLRTALEAMKFDGDEAGDTGAENTDPNPDGENGEIDPQSEGDGDPIPEEDDGDDDTAKRQPVDYALQRQMREELHRAFENEVVETPWGKDMRYWIEDYDPELGEVYCTDCTDWLTYGFKYSMNGDAIVVDFESKKRMKVAFVEFEEGAVEEPVFAHVVEAYAKEMESLIEFKNNTEEAAAEAARMEVLNQFSDLEGSELFEALKESHAQYDAVTLEEKCYAIRGRMGAPAKFSVEQKSTRIMVDPVKVNENEPYGGIFLKYKSHS